ncbi:MAG: hypothetical protein L0Y56_01980 [Nitrospira sp.]|nr:hypothetical protein [Nitrospira sp.]
MDLISLWEIHCEAGWPSGLGPDEGELMTLDTVISGCVKYYFSENRLDLKRMEILESCKTDLETLLPNLSGEAQDYFSRLRTLASLLLNATPDR